MTIIKLLGGLGLFIYGMKLMGDGLENAAGEGLKKILEKVTKNPVIAVIVGAVVTMVIQSSSATTVMVVGFVNAGLMNLAQAAGIIMGANIGTTVTAQLVSINLNGLAPVALGIGIILYLFGGKPRTKHIAEVLIGFGILFTGMDFMKDAVKPLSEYTGFTNALLNFGKYPILGLLLGFIDLVVFIIVTVICLIDIINARSMKHAFIWSILLLCINLTTFLFNLLIPHIDTVFYGIFISCSGTVLGTSLFLVLGSGFNYYKDCR